MAISSPQVKEQSRQDPLSYVQAGMQIGQMLQMKQQKDIAGAQQVLEAMDKVAQSSAGGWNGLMKIEGMQESVAGLFQRMGMGEKGSVKLAQDLGTAIPTLKGAMEMRAVTNAYMERNEAIPAEVYHQFGFTPPQNGGGQIVQEQPPLTPSEVKGTTYKWQEGQSQVPPGTGAKTTEGAKTIRTGETVPSGTPSGVIERLQPGRQAFEAELRQYGYAPEKHGSVDAFIRQAEADVPDVGKQLREKYNTLISPIEVPSKIDVTTPVSSNTPEQQKQIVAGRWTVDKKGVTVGNVENNIFKPNDQFKWTNETEMIKSLSSQVWGEAGEDVEAFKNMLYESAKGAGYKGSKNQFFDYKPPEGRPSSHGARMPKWYDWAVANGIEIKQPAQLPVEENMKYSGATPSRVNGLKRVKSDISYMIEKLDGTITRDISQVQPGDIITKYTPQQRGEATGGGYVKKEKSVFGYGTYEEWKKNEKYMRRHIGHYADFLYGNEKEWLRNMQNNRRVYENLGGDKIMEVLAPNQAEIQRAQLAVLWDQAVLNAANDADRIKNQKELGYAELELKRQLGQRGLDLEEYRNHLQTLLGNEELMLKKAMAELKYGEKTDDTAWKLYDYGYKYLEMSRKKYEGSTMNLSEVYKKDPIFATGYNMLLQASALRNGIDPNLVMDYVQFKSEKEPGFFGGISDFFSAAGKQIFGGETQGLPTYGVTGAITQEQKTQQQQQTEIEQREKEATGTLQEWGLD